MATKRNKRKGASAATAGTGIDYAKASNGEPCVDVLSAWDIDLPRWLDIGTYDGERLARNILEDMAEDIAGTSAMTAYGWMLFANDYRSDIENVFWTEFEEEEFAAKG